MGYKLTMYPKYPTWGTDGVQKVAVHKIHKSVANIVIVFANCTPDVKKLAMDRWKIFKIIGEDLVDVTKKIKHQY